MVRRNAGTVLWLVCLLAVMGVCSGPALAGTYDDFWSGTILPGLWNKHDPNGLFTVVSGAAVSPPQDYLLQFSGSGSSSYPGGSLATTIRWGGSFAAAISFFNFQSTGYTPASGDQHYPGVSLMIGDFGSTSNYYQIARAMGPGGLGDIIGWKEYGYLGNVVDKGYALYDGTSGALGLAWASVSHTLGLGYNTSPDHNAWSLDNFHFIKTFDSVAFVNDPFLLIAANAGGGGTLTADVGGLYSASVPLPGAIFLLAPGLIGLAAVRRRLKK